MAKDESLEERLDRELEELLQELRVALPGVQILFAFLLVVPFNNRFDRVTDLQRAAYVVALLGALVAVTFFIWPSAYHRLRFRQYDKERMIVTSTRLSVAGLAFLALALAASVFLVTDFMFDPALAIPLSAGAALLLVGFWFGLPLVRRAQD